MNILIWLLIIASFVLSFVGLIFPLIPGVFMIWIGVALYHFLINPLALTSFTLVTFIVLTVFLFAADNLSTIYFVKRHGGSRLAIWVATFGVLGGSFIMPPLGILIVPFMAVIFVELLQKRTFSEAAKIALATLIAFLSSTFAKAVIQLVMIIVFFLAVGF